MSYFSCSIRFLALILLVASPGGSALGADCTGTSTGFIPLNMLGGNDYQGSQGGLYPGGLNEPPEGHTTAALRAAEEVVPRDAEGVADAAGGKIVLLSFGMSNTTQEFSVFQQKANAMPDKHSRLVVVDGAQGGLSVDRILKDGTRYWSVVDERLEAAGVSSAQVQVGWMKQAVPLPAGDFPDDAKRLKSLFAEHVRDMKKRFPQLRLLYLSSRIYAGYASTPLNPEPYAYQSGFAVKWLIEDQINGDPELNHSDGNAPWLGWGPYLWADGMNARPDGLRWECADLAQDGTHPSDSGREKAATMLLDFFRNDTTARSWFLSAMTSSAVR